jgi:hypothetical protein
VVVVRSPGVDASLVSVSILFFGCSWFVLDRSRYLSIDSLGLGVANALLRIHRPPSGRLFIECAFVLLLLLGCMDSSGRLHEEDGGLEPHDAVAGFASQIQIQIQIQTNHHLICSGSSEDVLLKTTITL